MNEQLPPAIKLTGDLLAAGIAGGTLLGFLPQIAAALSIVWLVLQIYDWVARKLGRERDDTKGR
jgi:hypothetical protein